MSTTQFLALFGAALAAVAQLTQIQVGARLRAKHNEASDLDLFEVGLSVVIEIVGYVLMLSALARWFV